MTTIGTSIFHSKLDAVCYYELYGFDASDVQRKIDNGEISIGPLPPNSRWNVARRAYTKTT